MDLLKLLNPLGNRHIDYVFPNHIVRSIQYSMFLCQNPINRGPVNSQHLLDLILLIERKNRKLKPFQTPVCIDGVNNILLSGKAFLLMRTPGFMRKICQMHRLFYINLRTAKQQELRKQSNIKLPKLLRRFLFYKDFSPVT